MRAYKSIVISIVTVVLSACGSAVNTSEQLSMPTPDIGTDVQVGEFLEITAPNGWNLFKTDGPISLEIRNISKNQITSGPDFGARIFVRTDKGWIEVKNKQGYEYQLFTLDPTESYDPLKIAAIGVRPDLPDHSIPSDIRIFVFGDLIENGKASKKIASFIDLRLNP